MSIPADLMQLLAERGSATNGHAKPAPSPPFADGRAANGRFQKGWRGGPGNPHAKRVAALRSALLDAVSPATLKRLVKKLIAMAQAGDLDAARLVLLYTVGRPAEAVDPDKAAAEEIQRLTQTTRRGTLSLLAGALTPARILEVLAGQLGLTPQALQQSLFAATDTVVGLQVRLALDQLADLGRGKFPAEMGGLVAAQYIPRLARLLDDLADDKTPPALALGQAEAVSSLLDQLDRAGALDPDGRHAQPLARSLRACITKLTPAATTPEHRQLLGLLDKAAGDLETIPIGDVP